jgi:hypothetical protein
MSLELQICGLLFYNIIVTNVASNIFGYKTSGKVDPETKLQEISKDPNKFKIAFVLIIIEHLTIIALAIMLFMAFGLYNLILGVVWVIFRGVEGAIQIYNKKDYWGLFNLAEQYQNTNDMEKKEPVGLAWRILDSKNSNFIFAQILFSIGTLSYSILFVAYEAVPILLGWFGIVASILYGLANFIIRVKPISEEYWGLTGLAILIYELILGGWLIFLS